MATPYVLSKRSQRSIEEDPDVLLRIGMSTMPLSYKSAPEITLEIPEGSHPLKSLVLSDNWKIITKDQTTDENIKIAMKISHMKIKVSNSAPNFVMRKSQGFNEKDAKKVIDFLKKHPGLLNRSDDSQWDSFAKHPKATPKASCQWWFEDMTIHRQKELSEDDTTVQIATEISAMKNDPVKLRHALYLIGLSPDKNDNVEDLYYMLSSQTIRDPKSEYRRKFVEFILNPKMSKTQLDILRLVKTGLACGSIQEDTGFLVFNTNRLGVSDIQAVEHLQYDGDLLKQLRVDVSTKTGLPEDVQAANKAIGQPKAVADETRAIAWVSDRLLETGLSQKPHLTLKDVETLEDAVTVYNKKVKDGKLGKEDMITVDKVLEEIGAS